MDTEKMICQITKIAVVTAIGFLAIPPLMQKYGNKLYRFWLEQDEIDLENTGPEIVKKKEAKEK